jgi:Mg-chelatase subunit ChlD
VEGERRGSRSKKRERAEGVHLSLARSRPPRADEPREGEKKGEENSVISADVGFKFQGKRIVFLIDVSGSMEPENKLPLLKRAFKSIEKVI